MTAQLSREDIKALRCSLEYWQDDYDPKDDAEQYELFGRAMAAVDMLLAGMSNEPVGTFRKTAVGYMPSYHEDAVPLYAAPPAPVAVPDEQHSERFSWSYKQWAEHLGGRHQNNDPACYYEFGSFMAVAEMLRQFGNVQRKVGWNACRAAMQAEPVTAANTLPGWIKCSERMPGSQEWVLVSAKWANQQVLCWDDISNRWTDFEDQNYFLDMFSHWMPLPAAPEQEV